MRCLAIISARSGSKGLIDKNIKLLAGKPLIAYSIEAAKKSGIFAEVMVSTDSPAYAEIAEEWGANVPFLRSEHNSTDTASSWDMIKEVLSKYEQIGKTFDAFCLLQPTSPLRTAEDIQNAFEILKKADTAVVSVCEVDHSPLWSNNLPADNSLDGFIRQVNDKHRQLLDTFYRVNGAIYFVKVSAFLENTHLYRKGSYAYIMPRERSVDIDTELDFRIAELILNA